MSCGLPIPSPDIVVSGPFKPGIVNRWMRRNRARAQYTRNLRGRGNQTLILLHMRPQPSIRTDRGMRDVVGVLTHETLHWVLEKYEMPACRCLDKLPEHVQRALEAT